MRDFIGAMLVLIVIIAIVSYALYKSIKDDND